MRKSLLFLVVVMAFMFACTNSEEKRMRMFKNWDGEADLSTI